jgi:hypothetical protein
VTSIFDWPIIKKIKKNFNEVLDNVSQNRDVVISSFGLLILVVRIKLKTKDKFLNVKI